MVSELDEVTDKSEEYSTLNYLQSFGRKVNIVFTVFAGLIAVATHSPYWIWSVIFSVIFISYSLIKCYYQHLLKYKEFFCSLFLCGALNCVGTLFSSILFQILLLRMVLRGGPLRAVQAAGILGSFFVLTSLLGAKLVDEFFWMDMAYNLLGMGILTASAIHMQFLFGSKRDVEELQRQSSLNFQMAFTDALTGLYNYRAYQEKIAMLSEDYVLLIIDIDRFKNVNDTYGHEFGNNVLVHLANIVKNSIRYSDMAFRYGGEEFVVVLPGFTEELGLRIAERLRVQIAERKFYFETHKITVTVSIGVAVMRSGFTAQTVFEQADRALYAAKESGRNNVKRFVS